jgi:hypothetical protein
MTVGEALQAHYAAAGLPPDGGCSARAWAIRLGPVSFPLRNFAWRRRALRHHDIHHLLTGYACTPAGEFEMAAWEFAAGRYPSAWSTLFCLPLVGLGALATPRRSFAAFVRGRHSRTLYSAPLTSEMLALPIEVLRQRVLPRVVPAATIGDLARYLALAALSLAPLALLF